MSDELKGFGKSYTAEFWEYDARLGLRWNIDPMIKAGHSPYMAFNNNPIYFSDPLGLMGVPKQQTVQKKDNLSKIAKDNGVSVKDLLAWNPSIKNKDLIYPGQAINVSDPNKDLLIGVVEEGLGGDDAGSALGGLPSGPLSLPGLSDNPNDPDQLPNKYFENMHSSVSTAATMPKRGDPEWVKAESLIYSKFYSRKGGTNTETYGISREMAKTSLLQNYAS